MECEMPGFNLASVRSSIEINDKSDEDIHQELLSDYAVEKVKKSLFPNDHSKRETSLEFKNQIISKGLCFSCTANLTSQNYGVKCQSCQRVYHGSCIKRLQLHKSNSNIFTCITCLLKYQCKN
ncbi:unnamed protein product [Psylliodes chrysocephalus]|uniref:Phorbol-ester/DAG-type domain-containing protein n=1 Tax=Psylliodes chrysocephalus TaxID=3402493 RepID=A0A9P0CWS9_9CUCU|nr:unnamed protein product [Psylliodes chrysocephala]